MKTQSSLKRNSRKTRINAFLEIGNPFLENEKSLVNLFSKKILGELVTTSAQEAETIGKTKTKQKVVSLNSDGSLSAELHVACQSREGDL